MNRKIKNEHILLFILILFVVVISIINSAFFTASNLIDILRSIIVTGLMAVGVALVIISGGIDISFPAIAAFAMYSTTKILLAMDYQGPVVLGFVIAGAMGLGLGSVNALIINRFKLPTLMATLGTSSIFSGALLTMIGSKEIYTIPQSMTDFAQTFIATATNESGAVSNLPASILILAGVVAFTAFMMRYTMLGRSIFAIGGGMASAERAGFPVFKTQMFIYGYTGLLAGVAGFIHVCMMRMCNPFDLLGTELTVIAAVVLGGVSITGGYGSMLGAMVGVLMVTVINKSLIIVGVSSYWQQVVVGLLIIIGTGVVSLREKRARESFNTAAGKEGSA